MNEQFWWYVSRSAGVVAWALALASVLWGIALATRALGPNPKAPWLLDLHRHLGGLTVLFTGIHLGALVADNYAVEGLLVLVLVEAHEPREVLGVLGRLGREVAQRGVALEPQADVLERLTVDRDGRGDPLLVAGVEVGLEIEVRRLVLADDAALLDGRIARDAAGADDRVHHRHALAVGEGAGLVHLPQYRHLEVQVADIHCGVFEVDWG